MFRTKCDTHNITKVVIINYAYQYIEKTPKY